MKITFCSLFSGSSGNAIYVGAGDTHLLVDAGLPGKSVSEALMSIGVLPETLTGILVTHEHTDHVKGVGVLSRKYRIPIYANARTWEAMERHVGNIAPGCRREFYSGDPFYINNVSILPYGISHDAAEPVGYRIDYGGHSVATATDMGVFTKKILSTLSGVDLLLLESNYDPDMLRENENYSLRLKTRIQSRFGHLSNGACAGAILELKKTGVQNIVLGHLSQENNTPELALQTVCSILTDAGLCVGEDVRVGMAWRDRVGDCYEIG